MAYDEALAARIRDILSPRNDVGERLMFGGICFMVREHMTVGITSTDLMVRVGPDQQQASLKLKGARPMDFTGRPLKGFIYVDIATVRTKRPLEAWIKRALKFTESLPPKKAKANKKPRPKKPKANKG